MNGNKTYFVSLLMFVHAVIGLITGQGDAAAVGEAIQELLMAGGLAALRHGVSKGGA